CKHRLGNQRQRFAEIQRTLAGPFARYISSLKDQRVAASKVLSGPQAQPAGNKAEFIEKVRRALYLGKIVSYAQGFSQLRAASEEYNWDLNYGEIAKI
ncbi:hypothetical protein ACUODJ_51740, partial [Escherichia sp. HC-CC]